MAASVTIVDRGAAGDLSYRILEVGFDSSYPGGGYPITPRQMGLGENGVVKLVMGTYTDDGSGLFVGWDYATGKLKVVTGATGNGGIEASGDLSAFSAHIMVWGIGQG